MADYPYDIHGEQYAPVKHELYKDYGHGFQDGYAQGKKEFEPKHGRWIRKESKRYWWWECSECGSPPPVNKYGGEWHSNYCPNCGARMDEVEE